MKRQDFNEIKRLEIKALLEKVKLLQAEIANLIMDKSMNKLKDVRVISKKRKDLAQILTVVSQKQLLQSLQLQVASSKDQEEVKSK